MKKSLKEKTQDLSNTVDALAMGSHDGFWLATEGNSNAFFQVSSLNILYLKDTYLIFGLSHRTVLTFVFTIVDP